MPETQNPEFELLSGDSTEQLNYQQTLLYAEFRSEFLEWIRTEGKNPKKHIGYEESNVRPLSYRVHQVFEYAWDREKTVLGVSPEIANQFLKALQQDKITSEGGKEYAENSKRKFRTALQAYFRFRDQEWEPTISFSDNVPELPADPLNLREREKLLNAALEYQSPPNYSNLSPEERDRWKAQIAQIIGKPKKDVAPEDWESLQRSWKIPSLISVSLDAGLRAALVERLKYSCVDLDHQQIHVPSHLAVKNDKSWNIELTNRSAKLLSKWLRERENNTDYDNDHHLWLNRVGNPYDSGNLNNLLRNLLDQADIEPNGRKLTWHSIRHSTGMYIYDKERDLGLVAEILRQKSLEAARKYAHPTPETKKDAIESIQGGIPK